MAKQIIFPEEKLVNELYELDNRSIRKAISEILINLEKENEHYTMSFFLTLPPTEEGELKGVMDFFSSDAFINEKKRRINQAGLNQYFIL